MYISSRPGYSDYHDKKKHFLYIAVMCCLIWLLITGVRMSEVKSRRSQAQRDRERELLGRAIKEKALGEAVVKLTDRVNELVATR